MERLGYATHRPGQNPHFVAAALWGGERYTVNASNRIASVVSPERLSRSVVLVDCICKRSRTADASLAA